VIQTQTAQPFTATASGATPGLVGTIGVQVVDDNGTVVIARTTADIIELAAPSGVYAWSSATGPATIGRYSIIWDNGSDVFAQEDMLVVAAPIATAGASGAPPYPTIGTIRSQAQQAQRMVRGRAFVASYTFGDDGDAQPDAETVVNVTIVNAEGFIVANDVPATLTETAATFALAPTLTPQRDFLTCLWVATIGGVPVTQVSTIDVCDARLFQLGDYAQYPEIATKGFTPAQLEQARMDAEDRLEWECGCAFTGRYGTEEHLLGSERHGFGVWVSSWDWDGRSLADGSHRLALRRPFVQTIRSISRAWVDPDDSTSGVHALSLFYARLDTHRSVIHYYRDVGDPHGGLYGDLTIGYEHGQPVADARRICLILARYRLLHGPLDQRATQMSVEGGGTINLATPGIQGSRFGIPEVDKFCDDHDQRVTGFVSGTW
jgi:hypothetical protein